MKIRFYIDPETGLPHIYKHEVQEDEVEDVLRKPGEDRPGKENSRIAMRQTKASRYLRVIYVLDREPDSVFVITAYEFVGKPLKASIPASTPKETKTMKKSRFPKGWDEERVKGVLDHYEKQTENEAVAEDEAAWEDTSQTFIEVPNDLVPAVRELLAKKVA